MNTPLVPASNFVFGGSHAYARGGGTPTWSALEHLVGGLEGGQAVAFSSGMAAICAVFDQLPVGATIAIPRDGYQGVTSLAHTGQSRGRWSVTELANEDTAAWVKATRTCNLVWLESPSNPLLVVADLHTICAASRNHDCLLVVDNTLATPLNQQPLALGADISIQSVTKFIGGHSDLLGGIAIANDHALHQNLLKARELAGATPGALECYLAVRGARTLALRLERSQGTAAQLAARLTSHPAVVRVYYPGLRAHPSHALAREQLAGFGSVISFEVADADTADSTCEKLALIRHATSFGAVESTLERRSAHAGQEHLAPGLLRLSVGIEDPRELWQDLAQALPGTPTQ